MAATALVASLCLAGCSPSASGRADGFEFWSFSGIDQRTSVDGYLAAHPDVRIDLTEVGSSQETAQALTAALAGGAVPDLVLIQAEDLPRFVANADNFVDLTTLGAGDIRSDYLPSVFDDAVAEDGRIVGIPTDVGGLSMAYRADLFAAAGLPTDPVEVAALWPTWDDFIGLGRRYTQATGRAFVDNVSTSIFQATVNQATVKYYAPGGEPVYDTNPEVRQAFRTAVEAYDAGISADLPAFSSGWTTGHVRGAFAVRVAPSWMLAAIERDAPETAGQWRVTSIPGVAGNWGGSYLAIPARADAPEAAWDYIRTTQAPQAQLERFEQSGVLPAAASPYESDTLRSHTDPFFGDSAIGAVLGDSVAALRPRRDGPDSTAIGTAFHNALLSVEAGTTSPADAWALAIGNARAALGG